MKKAFLQLFVCFTIWIFAACNADKMYKRGNYADAFVNAIRTVERKPHDAHNLDLAKKSHIKLIEKEDEQLVILRDINTTQAAVRQVEILEGMHERFERLKRLPTPPKNLPIRNTAGELQLAKATAAAKLTADADELMKEDHSLAAQRAFVLYQQAKILQPDLNDLDNRIERSREKGMIHILYRVENPRSIALPPQGLQAIENLRLDRLNREWLQFHEEYDPLQNYEYVVTLFIDDSFVSSNRRETKTIEESKEITTGFTTKKNADGKEEKVPIKEEVKAKINVTEQSKEAWVRANIEISQTFNGNVVAQRQITGNENFKHEHGTFKGSEAALSEKSQKIIKAKAIEYPANQAMTISACRDLGSATRLYLQTNRRIFTREQ
jgi:hypothetical protein